MTAEKNLKGRSRAWVAVSTATPILSGVVATQLFTTGRSLEAIAPPQTPAPLDYPIAWYALAALVLAVGVTVAIAAKVIEGRKKTRIEELNVSLTSDLDKEVSERSQLIVQARLEQLVQLHDELIPIASTIADMARHPLADRAPRLESAAKVAATALTTLVSGHVDRPRAVIYWLDVDSEPIKMTPIGSKGRGSRPGPFEAGTARGNSAIDFAHARTPMLYPDLRKKKPAGYAGRMAGYKTFAAAPIWTETGTYGMVSLDAPEPECLTDGDLKLTALVAELMSIAFEVGQDQDTCRGL